MENERATWERSMGSATAEEGTECPYAERETESAWRHCASEPQASKQKYWRVS